MQTSPQKKEAKKIIGLHYLQSGNFGNIILSQDCRACPHQGWGLIKPLAQGRGVKEKHACQSVHLPSKAYGANLIKSVGGGFEETFTSLMWKIRPGCKNPNQTTVGSLGVIRAKEEPAAASSTASQSPPHAGSPLAGQGRAGEKTSAHPFICLSGFRKPQKRETAGKFETRW